MTWFRFTRCGPWHAMRGYEYGAGILIGRCWRRTAWPEAHRIAAWLSDLLGTRANALSLNSRRRIVPEWPETVDRIRREHNGVMRVDLYFGHDGDNVCRFSSYDKELAKGESGRSMQEAVDRCVEAWELERAARASTKYNWESFSAGLDAAGGDA